MPISPLFLDNHLLVLDKPAGLLTQPSGTQEPSLEEDGKTYLKERFQKPGAVFLEAIHRIDRPVAGVVLFARTSKALSRLNERQREGAFQKFYHALVCGTLEGIGTLEHWLRHDDFRAIPASPQERDARLCRLQYRSLEQRNGYTLLEICLETGRYHQIRAQLALEGHPIAGDTRYGASPASISVAPPKGIALLSQRLVFPHPITGCEIAVESRFHL